MGSDGSQTQSTLGENGGGHQTGRFTEVKSKVTGSGRSKKKTKTNKKLRSEKRITQIMAIPEVEQFLDNGKVQVWS